MNITSNNLFLLGDIHAGWKHAESLIHRSPPGSTLIQLGDLGFDPLGNFKATWPPTWDLQGRKLFFIPGNHEDHSMLPKTIEEVAEGVTYLPRGTVLEINGIRTLCIGGADSVSWDRKHRVFGKTIFKDEGVLERHVEPLLGLKNIDMVLSHGSPREFNLGLKPDLFEGSLDQLSRVLRALMPQQWFFAHYHFSRMGSVRLSDDKFCEWRCLPHLCMMKLDLRSYLDV
jgi:UDP-2,3-diacylglucosamine pyrophosphatase LpxH